jgi:hypothetical protein
MVEWWNEVFGDLALKYWEHRHPACALPEQARCLFSQCLMPVTTASLFQYSIIPLITDH